MLQGEEYKVIWPDQPEFVRMAAKFGATIVPFGAVGEDDIARVCYSHLYLLLYNGCSKLFLFSFRLLLVSFQLSMEKVFLL